MSVSVDGKISISIRDLAIFANSEEFQKFVTDVVEPKVIESATSMYTTTTRGGGTFQIQPLQARCFADADPSFRGVEVSVSVSGRFG